MRLYTNGPLTPDEYPPKPSNAPEGFGARTDSQLRYHVDFEYIYNSTSVTCQSTNLIVYAVFEPKSSWADPQRIADLLDHEQGHFDITHKHALLANAALTAKAKRKQFKATASNAERARAGLAKRIEAEIEKFAERGVAENKAYDEATRHGALTEAQKEWRERQKKELRELQEKKSGR
jgi:hypothetical protein